MSQRYVPILTLECRHDYYRDGLLANAAFVPSPATAQFLRNHRMLFKQHRSGFRILQECRTNGDASEPVVAVDGAVDLVFGFKSGDAAFQVKTDVEFYSSNRRKLVGDLRGDGSRRLLPLAGSSAVYTGEGKAKLIDTAGNVVAESGSNAFDLSRLAENVYAFDAGSGPESPFLLLRHDEEFDAVFIMSVGAEARTHTFRFPARRIHWQYIVVQKYNAYSDLLLTDETGALQFERMPHPAVDKAFAFVTTEPVLLSETYAYNLQIEDQGRVVKKKLPFANLSNCGKCLQNVENLCLENYVAI